MKKILIYINIFFVIFSLSFLISNQNNISKEINMTNYYDETNSSVILIEEIKSSNVNHPKIAKNGDIIYVSFKSSVTPISLPTVKIQGTLTLVTLEGEIYTASYILPSTTANGELNIEINVEVISSNMETTIDKSITIDNEIPVIKITSSKEYLKLNDKVTFKIVSSEPLNETNYELFVNNKKTDATYKMINTSTYEITYKVAKGDTNKIKLLYQGKDLAGNHSKEVEKIVTIDNDLPVISKINNNDVINHSVTPSITDENLDQVYLNGNLYHGENITREGYYTLKAIDKAGNTKSISFTIDKLSPIIMLSKENENAIRINVTDNNYVSIVKYVIALTQDNMNETKLKNEGITIDNNSVILLPQLEQGEYLIWIYATDSAGNASIRVSDKFILEEDGQISKEEEIFQIMPTIKIKNISVNGKSNQTNIANLLDENLKKSNVYITYTITITNQGNIQAKVLGIKDIIPKELLFEEDDLTNIKNGWILSSNYELYTDKLKDINLDPGVSVEVELVLKLDLSNLKKESIENIIELKLEENKFDIKTEDLTDKATFNVVMPKMAKETYLFIIYIILLIVLGITLTSLLYVERFKNKRKLEY